MNVTNGKNVASEVNVANGGVIYTARLQKTERQRQTMARTKKKNRGGMVRDLLEALGIGDKEWEGIAETSYKECEGLVRRGWRDGLEGMERDWLEWVTRNGEGLVRKQKKKKKIEGEW
jgi:hypothetical protein